MDNRTDPEYLTTQALLAPVALKPATAPYGYEAFLERRERALRRTAVVQRVGTAALAAVGIAVVALLVISARSSTVLSPAAGATASASQGVVSPVAIDERWLAALPREPAIARVSARAPAVALEDRIAWLDDTLSIALHEDSAPAADLQSLRVQRAQLVDALVRVRYAEQLSTRFN